jgi:mannose-6-phosphate isomerase-like protein (cupin superfamily)
MNNIEDIEVTGAERDKILAAIERQVAEWGLKMPYGHSMPLHFGLDRFREVGTTEFCVADESSHGYCGKFLFVFDGQTCPTHHHYSKHETFFVLKGKIRMTIGGEEIVMREGDVQVMPPGIDHSFTGVGPALILEASTPESQTDVIFTDPEINETLMAAEAAN